MATLTIQIEAQSTTIGRVKTISGPHLTRFLDAYRALLGQVDDGEGGMRDMTDGEVVLAWADGLIAGTRENVKRQEQEDAVKAASDAVTEIDLT